MRGFRERKKHGRFFPQRPREGFMRGPENPSLIEASRAQAPMFVNKAA